MLLFCHERGKFHLLGGAPYVLPNPTSLDSAHMFKLYRVGAQHALGRSVAAAQVGRQRVHLAFTRLHVTAVI